MVRKLIWLSIIIAMIFVIAKHIIFFYCFFPDKEKICDLYLPKTKKNIIIYKNNGNALSSESLVVFEKKRFEKKRLMFFNKYNDVVDLKVINDTTLSITVSGQYGVRKFYYPLY